MPKKKTAKKKARRRVPSVRQYVLNCVPSLATENDWTFSDAVEAGAVRLLRRLPKSKDLREPWWRVDDQGETGACVGFATAYGVLRWHYAKAGRIAKDQKPSARFIWMANKETDEITSYPTTFIESEGTQTKLALGVARTFGCVLDTDLPMKGGLFSGSRAAFYGRAAQLRIVSYHNLGRKLGDWRTWLATQGPILTRLNVDRTWDRATSTKGRLDKFLPKTVRGGHAVCLVGYDEDSFIVRNSWGTTWGDRGFAYASDQYAAQAFTEAYGAVL